MRLWKMTNEQAKKMQMDTKAQLLLKKGPSRVLRIMSWRELDYREQVTVKMPFCVVLINNAKMQFIMRSVNVSAQRLPPSGLAGAYGTCVGSCCRPHGWAGLLLVGFQSVWIGE